MIFKNLNTIKKIANDFDAYLISEVKKIEGLVIELNQNQMFAGKRSDGTPITPEYAPKTKKIKLRVGQPIDRVTLKDSGEMYKSMFIVYAAKSFTIYARPEYTKHLAKKYEPSIFGLSEEGLDKVREIVINNLEKILLAA